MRARTAQGKASLRENNGGVLFLPHLLGAAITALLRFGHAQCVYRQFPHILTDFARNLCAAERLPQPRIQIGAVFRLIELGCLQPDALAMHPPESMIRGDKHLRSGRKVAHDRHHLVVDEAFEMLLIDKRQGTPRYGSSIGQRLVLNLCNSLSQNSKM